MQLKLKKKHRLKKKREKRKILFQLIVFYEVGYNKIHSSFSFETEITS